MIITLFRSITKFCGIDNIPRPIFQDIFYIQTECGKYLGIFRGILLIPKYIIMDMNNVMLVSTSVVHISLIYTGNYIVTIYWYSRLGYLNLYLNVHTRFKFQN